MTESMRPISPPLPPDPRPSLSQPSSPPKVSRTEPGRDRARTRSTSRTTRSRTASTASQRPIIHQQQQPIRDAVDRAFDQSMDQSPTTAHLDPSFIAQVTEAVVKNLMVSNGTAQTSVYPPPPPPATMPHPRSPTYSNVASPETYAPPSPSKERERTGRSGYTESSQYHKPSVSQDEAHDSVIEGTKTRSRGVSDVSASSYSRGRESFSSHRPVEESFAARQNGDEEPNILEKTWQPLFDASGTPLPRLGQFLRGLALHLIDDYEPKSSLVVTPAKMMQFFEETKINDEIYPWRTIFGGGIGNASISVMYRRLLCHHHLVQTAPHECPNVPGLTPAGFEWFMICLIQAHPDAEFERLNMAVTHMPISNADDRKERFPKELSRRLLPQRANPQAEQRLIASMAHESSIQLKSSTAMPPPPPQNSIPQLSSSFQERERMPYSRTSQSEVLDDEDLSIQIERERKPYVAREGRGKQYGSDSDRRDRSADAPRPARQGSYSSSDPRSIPARTRLSTGPGSLPPASYNNAFPKTPIPGRRSPPVANSYARSEPGGLNEIPPSQFASNMSTASRVGSEPDDERYYHPRRQTTSTAPPSVIDDGLRGKPIPSRANTNSFDAGYGSVGMPPSLYPQGNSAPRHRSSQPSAYEEKRRSDYSTGSRGADAWNTFSNGAN